MKRTINTRIPEELDLLLEQIRIDLARKKNIQVSKLAAGRFLVKNFKIKLPKNI